MTHGQPGAAGDASGAARRPPVAALPHDHDACIAETLERAERVCLARGARLTPLRRRVLQLCLQSHRPRGAYDILEDLAAEGHKRAPLTVYRALDFLVGLGLVHRLESRNAYLGCSGPEAGHATQFLVCTRCGAAVEMDDPGLAAAIARSAERLGFAAGRQMVEVEGVCAACRAQG